MDKKEQKEFLRTTKNAEVSTAHITHLDSELLAKDDVALTVYDFEYGFRIYIDTEQTYAAIIDMGFSEELGNLYFIAMNQGCQYLILDRDGDEYDDLKKFDW